MAAAYRATSLIEQLQPPYCSCRPTGEDLRGRLCGFAAERLCYGYQHLWMCFGVKGPVNHNRIYRLYSNEGLKL